MSKHYKKLIVIILILAALGGGFYWYQNRQPINYQQGLYPVAPELAGKTIVLGDYIRYVGKDGKFAQELLKDAIGSSELPAAPDDEHAWKLYLNAQAQTNSPNQVMTKKGDVIEWVVDKKEQ